MNAPGARLWKLMPRADNVFYNLVTDENSTTELLCNLMRFEAFRLSFLRLFLSDAAASDLHWDDIDTQVELPSGCRPDLQIKNERFIALIEVKVSPGLGLTQNQPTAYIEYLLSEDFPERWLVFLVPKAWAHRSSLNLLLEGNAGGVHTQIVYWEDIVNAIERDNLGATNEFLNEFCQLLVARVAARPVTFSAKEVPMLFSTEVPTALSKLQQLIDGVRGRGTVYKVQPSASKALCPTEYGMYFRDSLGKDVFWFGVWTKFWMENNRPLCFGVSETWHLSVQQAFLQAYNGPTKRFERYIVGWIEAEVLAKQDAVDQAWAVLSPLVEATVAAGNSFGSL